jgi:hypothetical protein
MTSALNAARGNLRPLISQVHVLILTRLLIRTLRQPKAFLSTLFALPLEPSRPPEPRRSPKAFKQLKLLAAPMPISAICSNSYTAFPIHRVSFVVVSIGVPASPRCALPFYGQRTI